MVLLKAASLKHSLFSAWSSPLLSVMADSQFPIIGKEANIAILTLPMDIGLDRNMEQ